MNMRTNPLTKLESSVITLLLRRESEEFEQLRRQSQGLRVRSRELSGVGFFTELEVRDHSLALPGHPTFHLGDAFATIRGLDHGAGFVLFIDSGLLSLLEGYTFDEPWPEDTEHFTLSAEPPEGDA